MKRLATVAVATAGLLAIAVPAVAQEAITRSEFDQLVKAVDTVWVALAAALVLLMHLGFAMLEAGLTRAKNAANIAAKNMVTVAIGGTAYWAIGAALAYGADKGGFIGTGGFFNPVQAADLGNGTSVVFQLVFAATAATIVSGAVAERIDFRAYLIVATLLTAVIYPVVSHWTWSSNGWLANQGFHDFAGSTVVHLTGGAAALVGAWAVGPRIGKYGKDGRPRGIPGHNIPVAIFGVLVLFFGWFGFNGGSTLGAFGQTDLIGQVLLNTTIAGSVGGVAALIANWMTAGKPDPAMIGNGILAGLVGITAGADVASGAWSFVVGLVCGVIVIFAVSFFDRIRIDDPVGATSVHLVCGGLGTILVGVYADGFSLGTQVLGVLATFAFAVVTSLAVFLAIKATLGLRVPEDYEIEGLDDHEHGVVGLPDLAPGGVSFTS